jgi:hypothetical protein
MARQCPHGHGDTEQGEGANVAHRRACTPSELDCITGRPIGLERELKITIEKTLALGVDGFESARKQSRRFRG